MAAKRYEGRAEPEALLELFRESLLAALVECRPSLLDRPEVTASDKALLDLWFDGLHQSARTPGLWQQLLEETVPTATVRMLSVDPADAPSWWPTLRVVLTRWTALLGAHVPSGSLGLNIRETALDLSTWTEAFLRVNLTALFFREFSARLTSGNQEPAFRQASLAMLADLAATITSLRNACTPAEPLKTLAEFPTVTSIKRDTQLLNAQYRAFPYIGREDQIAKLLAWLDGPEPASFQVVAGGAGDGKTRLGFQLLEHLEAHQPDAWRAGWLGSRRAEDALRNERFRKWRGAQPTLIIIDYAASFTESLRDNVVRELAEESAEAPIDLPPLRILLLEREADESRGWYDALRREARDRAPDLFPNPVLRLPRLDGDQRCQLLSRVLDAARDLDARRNVPARPSIEIPAATRLSGAKFRQPLAICMAALVAHHRGNLTSLDLDRLDLAREVANHEYGRLERAARTAGKPPFLLLHVAAYVTCTGGLTEDLLSAICREEREKAEPGSQWSAPELQSAVTDYGLPPEDPSFAAEPIQPDIIGEAFVVKVLRHDIGHAAAETLQRAAAVRVRSVIRTLVRMVQDFSLPPSELTDASFKAGVEDDRTWALTMLTTLLSSKAQGIRDEDFWEIHAALPIDTTSMNKAYRNFYRAIHQSRSETDAVGIEALEFDCIHSGRLGDRAFALDGLTRVVNARRAGAGDDRERIGRLAWSLINLSYSQTELRLNGEALASAGEASRLLVDLAKEKDTIGLQAYIAMSLNALAMTQVALGQIGAAIESDKEAVRIRRALVDADPDKYRPYLAESLANLAEHQRIVGGSSQAVEPITEAIALIRELAETNPDAHLPNFATTLDFQARIQRDLGRQEAALESITEAVERYEMLLNANGGQHRLVLLKDLENALDTKAFLQRKASDLDGALSSIIAATQYSRESAALDERTNLRNLAVSLSNQYRILREMGKLDEAMKSIGEAVEHFRTIERWHPGTHLADLVGALNNQARVQWDLGLAPAAQGSTVEAIALCDNAPPAERDGLVLHRVEALSNLAALQGHFGNPEAALATVGEAIEERKLRPDIAPSDLARDLNNQALFQLALGCRSEAIDSIMEATRQYDGLARANPQKFLPELAQNFAFLGDTYLKGNQAQDAVPALHEALRLLALLRRIDLPIAAKFADLYEQACAA